MCDVSPVSKLRRKLRPGRNNKFRVAPVSTFEQGQLLVSEQVEVKRPQGAWQPASETWQSILAFDGKDAVARHVQRNGGCWVENIC